MSEHPFVEVVGMVEKTFDLRTGFLRELLASDDWSFVIKAHALLEAAVSQLLTQHVGDARLQIVFERLEMSNSKTGKLAFIAALDLLSSPAQGFVRKFSELRNELVHRVSNVNFRFPDHISLLDANQRKAWQGAFAYFVKVEPGLSNWRRKALEDPQVTMWLGTLYLLGQIHLAIATARAERLRIESELSLLQQLLTDMRDPDDTDLGSAT